MNVNEMEMQSVEHITAPPNRTTGSFPSIKQPLSFSRISKPESVSQPRPSVSADGEAEGEEEQKTLKDVEKWWPCSWWRLTKKKKRKEAHWQAK